MKTYHIRSYHIRYPRNFSNEYDLCYCENAAEAKEAEAAGFERITRKEAISKCANERWARKHDQNFSGYGSADILPWRFLADPRNDPEHPAYPITPDDLGLKLNGYIWE